MDPLSILAIFGPVAVEAGKALIQRFIAPSDFRPVSIGDYVAKLEADTKLFAALNNAGMSGPAYPWVSAIIQLQRPVVVVLATSAAIYATVADHKLPLEQVKTIYTMAGSVWFYLFGDRVLFHSLAKGPK